MPSASLISCAFLGDCVYLMRDSRRTPDGHPVRQSYRLLSHINRDKLDIFRIEKLWKNEKYVLRFYLFSSSCTLLEQCWIVTTILIIKLLPSLFFLKRGTVCLWSPLFSSPWNPPLSIPSVLSQWTLSSATLWDHSLGGCSGDLLCTGSLYIL